MSMPRSVKASRVAIVTGAGSGIGRAAAEMLLARGTAVVAVDRAADALRWCIEAAATGSTVTTVTGDVSDDATNIAAVGAALDTWGRLDVAVLNAGISGGLGFEVDGSLERLDQILAINVRGVASGIRNAAPAMRRTSDSAAIVVTASTSGLGGDPRNWAYNTSKAAVINMVRAAAMDYGCEGIRVNAVAPGPTETPMTEPIAAVPAMQHAMARRIPLQRWGKATELAEAICFLASPAASFIHGVTLPVDGGLSACAGHFELPERT